MADYSQLAARLDQVRWAWKRTAALAGLAILLVESLGIFTLLLVVDVVYRPQPGTRLALSLTGLAAAFVLLAWHVLRPIVRRIPDGQLALYVEEHNDRFEGALMTAAEFGPRAAAGAAAPAAVPADMIRAVLDAAARRVEREDPRRAVVVAQLKRYGLWAIVVAAVYAAGFLGLRQQVAAPARHVLVPLRVTPEDLRGPDDEGLPPAVVPIELRLTASSPPMRPDGSIRLPRGGSVELEVVLSRAPEQPVMLNYRLAAADAGPPAASNATATALQRLEMQSIDKVNTYALRLSDIDADLELFASTGTFQSPRHRIGVYEPLVLQGADIVVQYPAYMQLPDRTESQAAGDVVAPVGSKVKVRLLTNRPLSSAAVVWADGRQQAAAPDAARPETAGFDFDVTADTTYDFTLIDVDAQQIGGLSPCIVHAVPDEPPTVAIQTPMVSPLMVHPVGEILFTAEASDDFGLAGVDLVYLPQTDVDAKEVRLPLAMQLPEGGPAPGRVPVRCSLRLALEDLAPRLEPGTTISYFLEARDRNPAGRAALTNLCFISILPYEVWPTLDADHGPHPIAKAPEKTLDELLKGVWNLHVQRDKLPPADFDKQAEQWADWMLDPATGQVIEFVVLPLGAKPTPQRMAHIKKGNDYCVQAQAALKSHDTERAVKLLRFAMGEQALVEFDTTATAVLTPSGGGSASGKEGDLQAAAAALAVIRAESEVVAKLDKPERKAPKDDADATAEAQKEAAKLKSDQQKIIDKASGAKPEGEKPEAKKPEGKKPDGEKPEGKRPDGEKPQADKAAGAPEKELASEQTGLAARAKAAAMTLRKAGGDTKLRKVAERLDEAARQMTQAADAFHAGEKPKALDRANRAKGALEGAEAELAALDHTAIEQAISGLRTRAERAGRQQKELREKVEQVAAAMPEGKQPNARQQRDLKGALAGQLRLKVDVEKLSRDLAELDQKVKTEAKRETAKAVADAAREMRRGRVDQKSTNAVVELSAARPRAAAGEQKAVVETLQKVVAGLENAENTLASDWKSEARRAKREADSVHKNLATLSAKTGSPPTPEARKDLAEETVEQAARLARHVAARDLGERKDIQALQKATANASLLVRDVDKSEPKRADLSQIVHRISNAIEAEMQAKIDAEKLFSAQREECPPQYRDMVNKYYEALSKVRKP